MKQCHLQRGRGRFDTDRRMHFDHDNRSTLVTSQGMPAATRSWKRQEMNSLQEGAWPFRHLDFVVQFTQSCPTLCDPMDCTCQASLSITTSWSLLRLMSIESLMPYTHLILCHPLLLPLVFPSIKVFSNELTLRIRQPKYWSFSISPSNEYSGLTGLISLQSKRFSRVSSIQHHNSKASILWHSAFLMVQLSHQYMTTGKTLALLYRPLLAK